MVDLEDGRFLVCGSAKGTKRHQRNLFIWTVVGDGLQQIAADFQSMGTVETVRYGDQVYLWFHAAYVHSPEGEVIGVDQRQTFLFHRDREDPPEPISELEEGVLTNVKSSDPRFVFETEEGKRRSHIYLKHYSIEAGEWKLEHSIELSRPRDFDPCLSFHIALQLIGTNGDGDGLVLGERMVASPPDRVLSNKYQKHHATREEALPIYSLYETALWRVDRHTGAFTLLGLMPGRGDYSQPIFQLSADELLIFRVPDGFAARCTTVLHQWTSEHGLRALGELRGTVLPIGVVRDGNRLICTDAKDFYELQLPDEG